MRLDHETPYPLRLLVLPVDAHSHAAVAHYAATMARHLARERDRVFVAITPGGWCTPLEADEPMHFVAWLAPSNHADAPDSRRGQKARAEAVEATRSLVKAVQPECVLFVAGHAGHGTPLLEGVAAAGVPTAVVVLDAHHPAAAADARPVFLRRQACAQQWITISTEAQRVLARRLDCLPGAIEVCPEGVPIPLQSAITVQHERCRSVRSALNLPATARLVTARGRMDETSGCLDWAEAVAMLDDPAHDALFVWIGQGPLLPSVQEIIRRSNAGQRVRILPDRDAPEYLDLAADLAIFPARAARPLHTIGKAMATGVPVVATAVNPVTEVVRPMREGVICPRANPASLADAIRYALDNPAAMHAMANAAFLRIQDYSEERAVHALRPILERISLLRGAVRSPGVHG